MSLDLDRIKTAQRTLTGKVVRTPLVDSQLLSDISGANVFLKLENLQYTASFKERGALVKLSSLSDEQRARGVIAMSAGNHAQGVARHAKLMGIPATIVMPKDTPFVKVAQTEMLGARVVLHGDTLGETTRHAEMLAERENFVFVHPFDDEAVMAGQGTIALEMLQDQPDLDAILVPVGGGGLLAGVAVAAKAIKPDIRIIGVEASFFPSMKAAVQGSAPAEGGATIAEGIAVKTPGERTRAIAEQWVDDFLVVDEAEMESAVQLLLEVEKTVAEGAGAAPLAALIKYRDQFQGQCCGLIVSGGNIDSRLLASILMRGLARSGRLVRLRISIPDRPGQLAEVAKAIGNSGGNIIEILHQRLFHDVPVKATELDVVVETRGPDHTKILMDALQAAGCPARQLANTSVDAVAAAMVLPPHHAVEE
ncbi:threonine ammonia-lyase [Magnetospira sp. QH-2]|uniref:threonine ammonia-lyase n=1 Tax=Magnetospira sp. (strain QH-2) TaxID=1288970 RepID=UPI0003E80D3B|nr:threonine ammonia-lyase [Magnetospira sp. QH-2]CCQ73854.1 Threonine ammonia-lyase [Magnetospira sp. QH-2]